MSKFRDQLPPLHVIYEWDFCHGSNNGINRNTVYDKTGQHYFKIDGCDFGNKKLIQNFSYLRYSTIDNPNDQYGADWTSVSTHDNIVTGNISSIQFFRWNEANNIDIYINKDWYIKIVGATIKRVCTYADVIDNPHGYEIITGGGNKYQNMEDFTALIGTSNTMAEAGIDPTEHLLKKFVDNELAEGMCVMEENQDAEWVKDLITAYTSDAAKENVPASTGFEPAEEE